MHDQKFSFWPLGIAFFILVVVGLIIWTLYFALRNPVQREDSFLATYQDADLKINQIQQAQKDFLAHYDIVWKEDGVLAQKGLMSEYSRGQTAFSVYGGLSLPGFEFMITPKGIAEPLEVLSIEALLTRPHTKEYDQSIHFISDNGYYKTGAIELPAYGRWVIQGMISYRHFNGDAEKKGYFKYEFFAKEL